MIIRRSRTGSRDPWVIEHDGAYYYCYSWDGGLNLIRSETLEGILDGTPVRVWTAPEGMEYSKELWAPELHIIDGKCYIYVACDDGHNHNHRMYVLSNGSSDPLAPYTMHGKIADSTNKWAIDGTVIQFEGKLYLCWSGWEGDENVAQNLYLAQMSDPFTICSERVLLSRPEYDWEKKGANGKPESPFINEGPCAVVHNGKLFLVYSAAGSWCNDYCLGMLRFKGGDVLNAANWEKLPAPVFARSETVKGPGHCSILVKDGEMASWLIYHAFDEDCKFGWNSAHAVAQPFTWSDDATTFGVPEENELV